MSAIPSNNNPKSLKLYQLGDQNKIKLQLQQDEQAAGLNDNLYKEIAGQRKFQYSMTDLNEQMVIKENIFKFQYSTGVKVLKAEDSHFCQPLGSRVNQTKNRRAAFSLFGVCDGHNGNQCAQFITDNFYSALCARMPQEIPVNFECPEGEGVSQQIRIALRDTFLELDSHFQEIGEYSGSTCTIVLITSNLISVANVGDSRCLMDTLDRIIQLTCDHRIHNSKKEQARLLDRKVLIAPLSLEMKGPALDQNLGMGPLRAWPGGMRVSRAFGGKEKEKFISACPHIRQLIIPETGCRVIVATDGLWDSLSTYSVQNYSRQRNAEQVANFLIDRAQKYKRGLIDDITVINIDILPQHALNFKSLLKQDKKQQEQQKLHWYEKIWFKELNHADPSDRLNQRTDPRGNLTNRRENAVQQSQPSQTAKTHTTSQYSNLSGRLTDALNIVSDEDTLLWNIRRKPNQSSNKQSEKQSQNQQISDLDLTSLQSGSALFSQRGAVGSQMIDNTQMQTNLKSQQSKLKANYNDSASQYEEMEDPESHKQSRSNQKSQANNISQNKGHEDSMLQQLLAYSALNPQQRQQLNELLQGQDIYKDKILQLLLDNFLNNTFSKMQNNQQAADLLGSLLQERQNIQKAQGDSNNNENQNISNIINKGSTRKDKDVLKQSIEQIPKQIAGSELQEALDKTQDYVTQRNKNQQRLDEGSYEEGNIQTEDRNQKILRKLREQADSNSDLNHQISQRQQQYKGSKNGPNVNFNVGEEQLDQQKQLQPRQLKSQDLRQVIEQNYMEKKPNQNKQQQSQQQGNFHEVRQAIINKNKSNQGSQHDIAYEKDSLEQEREASSGKTSIFSGFNSVNNEQEQYYQQQLQQQNNENVKKLKQAYENSPPKNKHAGLNYNLLLRHEKMLESQIQDTLTNTFDRKSSEMQIKYNQNFRESLDDEFSSRADTNYQLEDSSVFNNRDLNNTQLLSLQRADLIQSYLQRLMRRYKGEFRSQSGTLFTYKLMFYLNSFDVVYNDDESNKLIPVRGQQALAQNFLSNDKQYVLYNGVVFSQLKAGQKAQLLKQNPNEVDRGQIQQASRGQKVRDLTRQDNDLNQPQDEDQIQQTKIDRGVQKPVISGKREDRQKFNPIGSQKVASQGQSQAQELANQSEGNKQVLFYNQLSPNTSNNDTQPSRGLNYGANVEQNVTSNQSKASVVESEGGQIVRSKQSSQEQEQPQNRSKPLLTDFEGQQNPSKVGNPEQEIIQNQQKALVRETDSANNRLKVKSKSKTGSSPNTNDDDEFKSPKIDQEQYGGISSNKTFEILNQIQNMKNSIQDRQRYQDTQNAQFKKLQNRYKQNNDEITNPQQGSDRRQRQIAQLSNSELRGQQVQNENKSRE